MAVFRVEKSRDYTVMVAVIAVLFLVDGRLGKDVEG